MKGKRKGFLGIHKVVVFFDGLPPRGHRGLFWWCWIRRRRKGGDEIRNNGALGGLEVAVPNEVDGDIASEKRAIVVLEEQWLVGLVRLCQAPRSRAEMK
jgi:hypothetical protein